MRSPLPAHAELLLALARPELDGDGVEHCRELIAAHGDRLDWAAFLDGACRHRVLPLVGRNVTAHGLHRVRGRSSMPYPWVYSTACAGNRLRNELLAEEFGAVIRAMNESGLRYGIRKGPVLAEHHYPDARLRRMHDLDVLLDRTETPQLGELLRELGYVQGRLGAGGRIEPYDRPTRLFWRMNVTNELPFRKPSHHDAVEAFCVDICVNIFQAKSGAHVDVARLLDERVPLPLCGAPSFALSLPDRFIDVCAHLYKEAVSLHSIENGTDLQLMKFLDVEMVARAVRESGSWAEVVSRAERYAATKNVYYALHHTSLLYPGSVTQAELAPLRPPDLEYLDQYGGLDGAVHTWRQPFASRLFDPRRRREVTASSAIPPP